MYSETCQIISHMGSPVQESCTPGSTGGMLRKGHVYQPKPHVRIFCEGRTLRGVRLLDPLQLSLAALNPFRYRKYVYDPETGLYCLGSRYYDPEVGRFINADDFETLTYQMDSVQRKNLYQYCFNNPVNMQDEDGGWPKWVTQVLVGTAVIAAAAVLTVATAGTGTALACFAVGALKGAAVGAASGAVNGAITGVIGNRIATGSWSGSAAAALNGAAEGYMSGAITGFVVGGVTSNVVSAP